MGRVYCTETHSLLEVEPHHEGAESLFILDVNARIERRHYEVFGGPPFACVPGLRGDVLGHARRRLCQGSPLWVEFPVLQEIEKRAQYRTDGIKEIGLSGHFAW